MKRTHVLGLLGAAAVSLPATTPALEARLVEPQAFIDVAVPSHVPMAECAAIKEHLLEQLGHLGLPIIVHHEDIKIGSVAESHLAALGLRKL